MVEEVGRMTADKRNVFVVGLDEFQRGQLSTITNAQNMEFHQLLDPDIVTRVDEHGFTALLDRAREQLEAFDGSIDAIIAHWDFPTSVIVPVLAHEYGLPGPPLRAVMTCEHKHWARVAQEASVPEIAPPFAGFDPFDDDALEGIDVEYPFWVKPVKSFSSQLGFRIDGPEDFAAAMTEMREGVGAIGEPFNEALALVDPPPEVGARSGTNCLAEGIVSGEQGTVEGTVHEGEISIHGVFDSPKDEHGNHFARYEYPASTLPEQAQARMRKACERFLEHIGYEHGCFNAEFMWDPDEDTLCLVEVNTRISQSHSDLFSKVDGMSNHEVAVDLALGVEPSMPSRRGNFAVAAKCFIYTDPIDDGVVRSVPSEEDIAAVVADYPETHVSIGVKPGDRLSELSEQSSYRYDLGTLTIGAADREELIARHHDCLERLRFEIDPIEPDTESGADAT